MWKEEVEIEAFKNAVQGQLAALEEIFRSQDELESADPGMASRFINKIIDNIQIDITNVYARLEDDLSNPSRPWCFGATLGSINIFTANDDWERDFVTDQDITKKVIKLNNFAMFMNWSDNLDASQLNISLMSGDVLLENLQIKNTLFDNMPLPFKLHYGKVG